MHNQWCGTETRQMMTTGNLKVRRKGCNCQVLLMAGFGKLKAKVSKPSAWAISGKGLLAAGGWRVQLWVGHLTYGTGQARPLGGPCEGGKTMSSSVGIKIWGRKEWAEKGGGEGALWDRVGRKQGALQGRRKGRGGERAEEGGGWLEARRGPRRRVGAWQIGGACGDGDQMATWVLSERCSACTHLPARAPP